MFCFVETPGPRCLNLIVSMPKDGQQSYEHSKQAHPAQHHFHVLGCNFCGMKYWFGDSDTSFNGHHTAQKKWAQARKYHGDTKNTAQDVWLVKADPVFIRSINKHCYRSVDEVAEEVCDHQATSQEQKRCLGLLPKPLIGLHEDSNGKTVG